MSWQEHVHTWPLFGLHKDAHKVNKENNEGILFQSFKYFNDLLNIQFICIMDYRSELSPNPSICAYLNFVLGTPLCTLGACCRRFTFATSCLFMFSATRCFISSSSCCLDAFLSAFRLTAPIWSCLPFFSFCRSTSCRFCALKRSSSCLFASRCLSALAFSCSVDCCWPCANHTELA